MVILAGTRITPVIARTGNSRMAEMMVLYKLRATGRICSPALLKKMTAIAYRIAEDNARVFPRKSAVILIAPNERFFQYIFFTTKLSVS